MWAAWRVVMATGGYVTGDVLVCGAGHLYPFHHSVNHLVGVGWCAGRARDALGCSWNAGAALQSL
jgi:hypothetical protein